MHAISSTSFRSNSILIPRLFSKKKRTEVSDKTNQPFFKHNQFSFSLPANLIELNLNLTFKSYVVVESPENESQNPNSVKFLGDFVFNLSDFAKFEQNSNSGISKALKFTRNNSTVGRFMAHFKCQPVAKADNEFLENEFNEFIDYRFTWTQKTTGRIRIDFRKLQFLGPKSDLKSESNDKLQISLFKFSENQQNNQDFKFPLKNSIVNEQLIFEFQIENMNDYFLKFEFLNFENDKYWIPLSKFRIFHPVHLKFNFNENWGLFSSICLEKRESEFIEISVSKLEIPVPKIEKCLIYGFCLGNFDSQNRILEFSDCQLIPQITPNDNSQFQLFLTQYFETSPLIFCSTFLKHLFSETITVKFFLPPKILHSLSKIAVLTKNSIFSPIANELIDVSSFKELPNCQKPEDPNQLSIYFNQIQQNIKIQIEKIDCTIISPILISSSNESNQPKQTQQLPSGNSLLLDQSNPEKVETNVDNNNFSLFADELRQKQFLIANLVKEYQQNLKLFENTKTEIVEMSQKRDLLLSENQKLKREIYVDENLDINTLVTQEIDGLNKKDLKIKLVKMAQLFKDEKNRNKEFQNAIENINSDLGNVKELKLDYDQLIVLNMKRNQELSSLQSEIAKTTIFQETIRKQELLISKLQKSLEECIQNNQKGTKMIQNLRVVDLENQKIKQNIEIEFENFENDEQKNSSKINLIELQKTKESLIQVLAEKGKGVFKGVSDLEKRIALEVELYKAQERVTILEERLSKIAKEKANSEQIVFSNSNY